MTLITETPEATTLATQEPTTAAIALEQQADESQEAEGQTVEQHALEALEYTDFEIPEGVVIDGESLNEFKDIAKGMGLKQDQAQALTDIAVKLSAKWSEAQQTEKAEKINGWLNATKADKELGGDKLNENLAISKRALDAFATPELIITLNETGLGNHPELIRAFYKIGQQLSEDNYVVGGNSTTSSDKTFAQKLYPNSNMNP